MKRACLHFKWKEDWRPLTNETACFILILDNHRRRNHKFKKALCIISKAMLHRYIHLLGNFNPSQYKSKEHIMYAKDSYTNKDYNLNFMVSIINIQSSNKPCKIMGPKKLHRNWFVSPLYYSFCSNLWFIDNKCRPHCMPCEIHPHSPK